MEAGGESLPHKAPPPARSATTATAGPRPLLIHRRYPCSSLFPRTGPAASSGSGAPPAGDAMDSPRTTEAGSGDTRPRPLAGGGKGGGKGPAPQGSAPSGPAPGPAVRGRGDGGRAPSPPAPANGNGVYSTHRLLLNHSIHPLRLEKSCQVIETHRNRAFSLKNCKASICIDSELLAPRGGCILPNRKHKLSLYISYSQQKETSTFRAYFMSCISNIAALTGMFKIQILDNIIVSI